MAIIALMAAVGSGCRDGRVDDAELGSLVVARGRVATAIDVGAASRDVAALQRAVALTHSEISEILGAHRINARSSVRVMAGGALVSELSDETRIAFAADGAFSATADNSRDYGRHAIYHDGVLYLRPRYGKYHRRAPSSEGEPAAILDELFATSSAYFELLVSRIVLSDGGATQELGRPARVINFARSEVASKPAKETLAHRSWRESIGVEAASGRFVLDEASGAVLSAEFSGTISFVRDSKPFMMEVTASHSISDLGAAVAITPPPAEETVSSPTMTSEVDDQKALLEGLTPVGTKDDEP